MKTYEIRFQGALLQRGFWLYVWRVTEGPRTVLYVGRTGDSSSRYAASPFSRLGQHLDLRETATANMLLRNLRKAGLNPVACSYSLFAIGPIYPECDTLESHRETRDLLAPLEAAIAARLRADGHEVLGTHSRPRVPVTGDMYEELLESFRAALNSSIVPANSALHPTGAGESASAGG